MEGTVTISVQEFESLRKLENAVYDRKSVEVYTTNRCGTRIFVLDDNDTIKTLAETAEEYKKMRDDGWKAYNKLVDKTQDIKPKKWWQIWK